MNKQYYIILAGFLFLISCGFKPDFVDIELNSQVMKNTNVLVDVSDESMKQLTFKITKKYPNIDLLTYYSQLLKDNNYILCEQKLAGWETFLDGTNDIDIRVFRNFKYFIKPNSLILASIILEYQSNIESIESRPDNSLQKVTIVQYYHLDLMQAISDLDLDCKTNS